MKKVLYITSIFLFVLASCGPKITPEDYNKIIIDEQVKITRAMLNMANEFQAFDFDKAEKVRADLVKQCDSSKQIVSDLPDCKGNTKFRDAAVKLFSFYADVSKKEYKEMVQIFQNGKDTGIDGTRLQQLQEETMMREVPLDNAFKTAQKEFATENGLSLKENNIQQELDNLGK